MYSCEAVGKGVCITRMDTSRNYSTYALISDNPINFRTFSIALLALAISIDAKQGAIDAKQQ